MSNIHNGLLSLTSWTWQCAPFLVKWGSGDIFMVARTDTIKYSYFWGANSSLSGKDLVHILHHPKVYSNPCPLKLLLKSILILPFHQCLGSSRGLQISPPQPCTHFSSPYVSNASFHHPSSPYLHLASINHAAPHLNNFTASVWNIFLCTSSRPSAFVPSFDSLIVVQNIHIQESIEWI